MTALVWCSGAETGEKTEFTVYGAHASAVSTFFVTGNSSFYLGYGDAANYDTRLSWQSLPNHQNFAMHMQFYLASTVGGQDIRLFSPGPLAQVLDLTKFPGHRLRIGGGGTNTGSTVLNSGQWYQVEMRGDGADTNKVYVRLNEVDEVSTTFTPANITSVQWGISAAKVNSEPIVDVYLDDLVYWFETDSTKIPPWLNTTAVDYRTVTTQGSFNQYVGSGDTTNKYLNVDDFQPTDNGVTYNEGGSVLAIMRQTHTHATVAYTDTIKGVMFSCIGLGNVDATDAIASNSSNFLIRDSATNYTPQGGPGGTSYATIRYGYQNRPGGATLTAVALNSMEVGTEIYQDTRSTFSVDAFPLPANFTNDYKTAYPTADSTTGDDNFWVNTVNGVAVFNHVNNSDLNSFMWTTGVLRKQGFKTGVVTTVKGMVLAGVGVATRFDVSSGTGTGQFYYKDTGGTYYYSNSIDLSTSTLLDKGYSWGVNPSSGTAWLMSAVTSGEFGVEVITMGGAATTSKVYEFQVALMMRANVRESSYWTQVIHGDGYTIVNPLVTTFPSRRMQVGWGR